MTTRPRGVLILSNDVLTPFAKTSDYLASALERAQIPAYVRDHSELRLLAHVFSENLAQDQPYALATLSDAFAEFCEYTQVDTVLSLDLNWFVAPGLFIDDPQIRAIHSYWFDDFRSWCTGPMNTSFPVSGEVFQKHVKHAKVCHHFYGNSQGLEAELLGVKNQSINRLAAPRHLLETDQPADCLNRIAFIGNPGFRGTPHQAAVKLMEAGAELHILREFARDALLRHPDQHAVKWFAEEPSLRNLFSIALEARRQFPYQPALQILKMAGTHYPRAFTYMNEKGIALDVAFLIKLVNRYDRPAFVHRLWKRGWIDVYSASDEWAPYRVEALPYVSFGDLPKMYRRYAVHLNAPNSIRDATANEKLFEIAASGRASINLDSPDVRSCYSNKEVVFVNSLQELESVAEKALRDPAPFLAMGEKARERTAREHLWDHRVQSIFCS